MRVNTMPRRCIFLHRLAILCAISMLLCGGMVGCVANPLRSTDETDLKKAVDDAQLVGDLSRPWGLNYQVADGVGLVVGLQGTGSDPPPSTERTMLLSDMAARRVDKPNSVLASDATALVTVRAILPPGVKKGDPVDLEINVPRRSTTASLRGGWLMQTRLREYGRVKDHVAPGHVLALAQGDVLVDALIEGSDEPTMLVRGRVLGGGVSTKTRNLGLIIRDEFLSVKTSQQIGNAINQRFHIYDGGIKRGVAKPMRDDFVELIVHPRYEQSLLRYVRVIQSIPVRESSAGVSARRSQIRDDLMSVQTSSRAALQLEALGADGVDVLLEGLKSNDAEIRFYASEALAYLDDARAVGVLADTTVKENAFRWRALTALQAMEHAKAHQALEELLHVDSAEARYGAFRALRQQMPDDPVVAGEFLGSQFFYHKVATVGEPMVHVSREERPEIVMFGHEIPLAQPVVLFAGNQIVAKSQPNGQIKVTRLSSGDEEEAVYCPHHVDALVRAIVELGGTFPDVVQALSNAKSHGSLACRLEFSALPRPGRTYHRQEDEGAPILDIVDAPEEMAGSGEEMLSEESESLADPRTAEGGRPAWPEQTSPVQPRGADASDFEVSAESFGVKPLVPVPQSVRPTSTAGAVPAAGDSNLEALDALEFDPELR